MKTSRPVLAASTVRIYLDITAQLQGTTPLTSVISYPYGFSTIGTTSSNPDFVQLYVAKFTIDFNGKITPDNMFLLLATYNDTNAECIIEISGDAGTTFTPMTDAIPGGYLYTVGPGVWIDNVALGNDGLQIGVLGRSTNGLDATIRIRSDAYIDMTYVKKFVL